jgi:hypothetical protein
MSWAGHVARISYVRVVYSVLVGRLEWKRQLRRSRRRWDDNIKTGLREIDLDGPNCIRLAQATVQWRSFVNTVMRALSCTLTLF